MEEIARKTASQNYGGLQENASSHIDAPLQFNQESVTSVR